MALKLPQRNSAKRRAFRFKEAAMKVEIRAITKKEAEPYGDNADIVLTGRKAVVFTDDAGNTGALYMKEEDIELLGESYIAENSTMEYSDVCGEWFPKVSWNAYKNDPKRNPSKTVDVEFVCGMEGECTEIWRRLDTGGYLMRQLCREPFARWLTCRKLQGGWLDGNCIRPNVTFRHGTQTETVFYDDWNGTAAYSSTPRPARQMVGWMLHCLRLGVP